MKVQRHEDEYIITGFSFEMNCPLNTAHLIYNKEVLLVTEAKASSIV